MKPYSPIKQIQQIPEIKTEVFWYIQKYQVICKNGETVLINSCFAHKF